MASRNTITGIQYRATESVPSSTLKRHPKMELNKTDLLRLLSYLEGELQARDVVIATLKAEKTKQLLYQAKYGRFGLGDPFHALQRDSEMSRDSSFEENAIKTMYDNQLIQLEHLIDTQRKAQIKMTEQMAAMEKKYHKVCSELEVEKRKHAQDTAQGDDVTMMLEKERERLRNEVDFERSQNKKLDKELKKATGQLEEETAMSSKHKQVALLLIKERQKVSEQLLKEREKVQTLAIALNQVKNKTKDMAEELAADAKKRAIHMEAAMEKKYSEFDIEREQLKAKLKREEKKNMDLQREIDILHRINSVKPAVRGEGPGSIEIRSSMKPELPSKINILKRDASPAGSKLTVNAGSMVVTRTPTGNVSVHVSNTVKKSAGRGIPPPLPATKPIYNPVKKEVVGRTKVENNTTRTKPVPQAKVTVSSNSKEGEKSTESSKEADSTALDFIGPEMADLQQLLVSMATGDTSPHDVDSNQTSLLFQLTISGNHSQLKHYLTSHTLDINQCAVNGATCLHYAARDGHTECLEVLLESSALVNCVQDDGSTPLHLAAVAGYARCISVLLNHGSNVHAMDKLGRTALYVAARHGHTDVCKLLLEHGSPLNLKTHAGWTAAHAAVQAGHVHCTELLLTFSPPYSNCTLANLADIANEADRDGWTVAHLAAIRESEECLKLIVTHCKPDLQKKDKWGKTVIQVASAACRDYVNCLNLDCECIVYIDCENTTVSSQHCKAKYNIGFITVTSEMSWSELEEHLGDILTNHFNDIARGMVNDGNSYSLGLSLNSVKHYSIGGFKRHPKISHRKGVHRWSPGTPFSSAPYDVLANNHTGHIAVSLFGVEDSCQDALAYSTLISVSTLQNYLRQLHQFGSVILYGPKGTGKTFIAKTLAHCVQMREKSAGNDSYVHVLGLTSKTTSDEVNSFLMEKGCLLASVQATPSNLAPVVVLDDLSVVNIQDVLGDLLTCLQSRHSQGLKGEVPSLHPNCFIIATMDRTRNSGVDLSIQQCFRWIHCQLDAEPVQTLLSRHLLRNLLHVYSGQLPTGQDSVCSAVEWVIHVWQRLNEGLDKLGLPELVFGPTHFLSCPINPDKPKEILRWLSQVWNHVVSDQLLTNNNLPGHEKVAKTTLYVLIQRAVLPGCPLSGQERERYLSGFQSAAMSDPREGEDTEMQGLAPRSASFSGVLSPSESVTSTTQVCQCIQLAKSQPNLVKPLSIQTTELGTPKFTPLSPKSPTFRSVQSPSLSQRLRTEFFRELSPSKDDS